MRESGTGKANAESGCHGQWHDGSRDAQLQTTLTSGARSPLHAPSRRRNRASLRSTDPTPARSRRASRYELDLWITSSALRHGLPLVTADMVGFRRVPELELVAYQGVGHRTEFRLGRPLQPQPVVYLDDEPVVGRRIEQRTHVPTQVQVTDQGAVHLLPLPDQEDRRAGSVLPA
jgi:hypothetical protein